ncbi:MAG: carbohydrate binding family 9 domain-containing protein, partial [Candidatus Coatesbacteria bacterium]
MAAGPPRAFGQGDQGSGEGQSVAIFGLPEGHLVPVFADVAPRLDGALDDLCWREAARRPAATAAAFIYRGLPYEFFAEEQTTAYVAYDEEYLYIGAKCEFTSADDVTGRILLRDANLWYDDMFEVFLDTFHDRKSAYYFALNPLNTQMDGYFSEEGEVENRNWDGVWYSATRVNHDSWTLEMKIPFRSLRFGLFNEEWGINFVRFHKHTGDQTIWRDTGENLLRVSLYGTMEAPPGIQRRPVVDVRPYVSGSYRDLAKNEDDEFDHKEGIDVAFRFLPSMAVVGTYRPDFAQVEADPYQINLTDEELFYPEKRPFFLEGQEYFDTPIRAFYSRRIGDIEYGGKYLGRLGPTHLYALHLDADEYTEDPENPDGPHRYAYSV